MITVLLTASVGNLTGITGVLLAAVVGLSAAGGRRQ